MDAFYLIDKPLGITSFDVLRKLKKHLSIKKMWHTGTLDPLATGLLLVAVWNYTKLIPYFEKDVKEYEFKISLDGTTPSFDSETQITFLSDEKKQYFKNHLSTSQIERLLTQKFSGKITQMPPKYSALKIGWQKALDMVRKGIDFELKSREVTIYHIEVLDFSYPELHLKAKVSAGTYIRSIASDLWEMLGTGGYITFLRRTAIGALDEKFSQKLDEFQAEAFLRESVLFWNDRFLTLSEDQLENLNHGRKIKNTFLHLQKGEDYFIKSGEKISHIIHFDGLDIIPVRKI